MLILRKGLSPRRLTLSPSLSLTSNVYYILATLCSPQGLIVNDSPYSLNMAMDVVWKMASAKVAITIKLGGRGANVFVGEGRQGFTMV